MSTTAFSIDHVICPFKYTATRQYEIEKNRIYTTRLCWEKLKRKKKP